MTQQQKPKKALRGLFSRTEPTARREESGVPGQVSTEPTPEPAFVKKFESTPTEVETKVAPKIDQAPVLLSEPVVGDSPTAEAATDSTAKEGPMVEEQNQTHLAPELTASSPNAQDEPAIRPKQGSAVEVLAASLVALQECDVTSLPPLINMTAVEGLTSVVNGFNASALDRTEWIEDEYLSFIRRIDQAQTEAFLLKGKLLEEVKRRFFIDNKQGWKHFCDDRLDMNYTTANQYIRVAEEFESLARDRPNFGFEHFKALLPLAAEQRSEILSRSEALSVKTIRKLVQEKLAPMLVASSAQGTSDAKNLVRSLEQLKDQILGGDFAALPQLTRWQLAAACQNVSEELCALAALLNKSSRESSSRIGASARDGESTL